MSSYRGPNSKRIAWLTTYRYMQIRNQTPKTFPGHVGWVAHFRSIPKGLWSNLPERVICRDPLEKTLNCTYCWCFVRTIHRSLYVRFVTARRREKRLDETSLEFAQFASTNLTQLVGYAPGARVTRRFGGCELIYPFGSPMNWEMSEPTAIAYPVDNSPNGRSNTSIAEENVYSSSLGDSKFADDTIEMSGNFFSQVECHEVA